ACSQLLSPPPPLLSALQPTAPSAANTPKPIPIQSSGFTYSRSSPISSAQLSLSKFQHGVKRHELASSSRAGRCATMCRPTRGGMRGSALLRSRARILSCPQALADDARERPKVVARRAIPLVEVGDLLRD